MVKGKNKEIVMSLREIAAGNVTFDNINDFTTQSLEEEAAAIDITTPEQTETSTTT